MFGMGMPEILLILAIALIVIGPKKLPDLAKSLGRAMNEFKKATNEFKQTMDLDQDMDHAKKTYKDVEKEVGKPLEISSADAENGALKTKNEIRVKEDTDRTAEIYNSAGKADKSRSSAPNTENDTENDDDMVGTDIPAELMVNGDENLSGIRRKGKEENAD